LHPHQDQHFCDCGRTFQESREQKEETSIDDTTSSITLLLDAGCINLYPHDIFYVCVSVTQMNQECLTKKINYVFL